MGLSAKPIDTKQIEELISLGCTEDEVAALMGISKKEFHRRFRDLAAKARAHCGVAIRRAQWQKAADGDPRALTFLGKQYLGQSDHPANPANDLDRYESFFDFSRRSACAAAKQKVKAA